MTWRDSIDAVTESKVIEIEMLMPQGDIDLTDFERDFVESTLERWHTYGPLMAMSTKQRNILTDIHHKLKG
ncbi:MAG: hypothetical protein V3T88_09165 [Nitrosomonadaceae bacterium]